MTQKFNVDGRFSAERAKEGGDPQLPAHEPEILPPAPQEDWKPRQAETINVPSPVLRRSFFGQPNHAAFQQEVREVEQSERAVTSLVRTRTEKEQAVVEHERALARRELMPALIEEDRLAVFSEVALARAALRRTLGLISRQQDNDVQAAVNDGRLRELEALEYETERARKQRVLAEEKARAAGAEEIAAVKAKAEHTKAERELREQERELERVQCTRSRFADDPGDDEADDPPAFREAMARERERQSIIRARDRRLKTILDTVGGDESKLSPEQIEAMESIKEASQSAERSFDLEQATGALFPHADEEESR